MPVATIIDIGTNTFEYLIVEYSGSDFKFLAEDKIHVRLGEGGMGKGYITEAALVRAIDAMNRIDALSETHGSELRKARATSATRDAQNASDLREIVESKGFELKVIDGEEEARLISIGASLAIPKSIESYLLMDIGGGSTEFILVKNRQAIWSQSFNIGVTRIMEKFSVADPLTQEDLLVVEGFLKTELKPLYDITRNFENLTLIGSAGSYDSILSIMTEANELVENSGFQMIPLKTFDRLFQKLVASTNEERSRMPGLVSYRVPTIHLAAFQIQHVLKAIGIAELARSPFALKEGVLLELMDQLKA